MEGNDQGRMEGKRMKGGGKTVMLPHRVGLINPWTRYLWRHICLIHDIVAHTPRSDTIAHSRGPHYFQIACVARTAPKSQASASGPLTGVVVSYDRLRMCCTCAARSGEWFNPCSPTKRRDLDASKNSPAEMIRPFAAALYPRELVATQRTEFQTNF